MKAGVLGIELGSTRIKSVLIDEYSNVLCQGSSEWENQLINGLWTYQLEDVWKGIQASYADLNREYESKFGTPIEQLSAIGISAMMHGYLAFDENDNLLVPFRTWRNTNTKQAADELTKLFAFNIPLRWSISHYYQAILNNEPHVPQVTFITTLAGYVHWMLTGQKVIGVGDASGMFPVKDNSYHQQMLTSFDQLLTSKGINSSFEGLLPQILVAGKSAGELTANGAKLLDQSGHLKAGCPLCPPEGDAGTGMTATNAISPFTANVSAGTSAFLMAVLDKELSHCYREIDMVATPTGHPVAMVHVNNFTNEINAWANVFEEVARLAGSDISPNQLIEHLFRKSAESDSEVGKLVGYNFLSGEPIAGVQQGMPLFLRPADGILNLPNFMQMLIYSALATLAMGMDILRKENVALTNVCGHGGFFKTEFIGANAMSAAVNSRVTVMKTAGEGGAWGISLLALYLLRNNASLDTFLNDIFSNAEKQTFIASEDEKSKFSAFLVRYKEYLQLEQSKQAQLKALKRRVYEQNIELVKNNLVVMTWGNVSAIDREKGLVVIKPSGVPYSTMTEDDMVVVDMEGNVVEGKYRPSSDTPTHLELYKRFSQLGGIVHTHSTVATAFAQAGEAITAYGTTHADAFYGDVPVTRALTKEEIEGDYELNTGKVIAETFVQQDILAIPAVLVKNHGVFTWGKTPEAAVEYAVTVEEVAKMALATRKLTANAERAPQHLLDKHYFRKHGKNAYYGQKNNN